MGKNNSSLEGISRIRGEIPDGFQLLPQFSDTTELKHIQQWVRKNVSWRSETLNGCKCQRFQYDDGYPNWAEDIAQRLCAKGIFQEMPGHLFVVRYKPGQGVIPHIDGIRYGDTIAVLSAGSSSVLELGRDKVKSDMRVLLFPGDLYVLQKAARYRWFHWIQGTCADQFSGKQIKRKTRLSFVFRSIRE